MVLGLPPALRLLSRGHSFAKSVLEETSLSSQCRRSSFLSRSFSREARKTGLRAYPRFLINQATQLRGGSQVQASTRRKIATTSSRAKNSSFSYTLNVSSAESLRTVDLKSLNVPTCRDSSNSRYDLVLLVSINLTTIIDQESTFLDTLLNHIFPLGHEVSVLAAVVDQVPSTKNSAVGCEGISLLYGPRDLSLLSSVKVNTNDDDGPGFLTFVKTLSNGSPLLTGLLRPGSSDEIQQEGLQVPLSKTLFQNGKLYTSHLSTWTRRNSDGGAKLCPSPRQTDYTPSIQLPVDDTSAEFAAEIDNLIDLTPVQYIGESKGNIIRETIDQDGNTSPASQLLQERVNQIHAQNVSNVASLAIYAAVFPKNAQVEEIGDDAGQRRPLQPASYFRVSGGGGEWGAKAGLLALECKSSYSEAIGDESDAMFMASLLGHDPMSTLDYFRPGLPIKFVGRLKLKSQGLRPAKESDLDLVTRTGKSKIIFSSAEEEPEGRPNLSNAEFEPKGQENLFGACSAEALAYGAFEAQKGSPADKLPSTLLPIGTILTIK